MTNKPSNHDLPFSNLSFFYNLNIGHHTHCRVSRRSEAEFLHTSYKGGASMHFVLYYLTAKLNSVPTGASC